MNRSTRRDFIKNTLRGGAAAGAAIAGSRAIAAPALLQGGKKLPSERFRVAHVGIGGRGGSLLGQSLGAKDVDVVAVCEVDQKRLGAAWERTGKRAEKTTDYRYVIDSRDIDAVVVATPDHWHALVTIDACSSGKDVYVEKPLSTFLAEGRAMIDAARRNKRVVQMGIHHRSAEYIRRIVEIIRSGCIGKVSAVKTWMWENKFEKRTPGAEPPAHFDFERWLGPAPKVPYHPGRTHYNFRWCRDYAGGYMTDWGVHMLNVVTWAMDIDHKGPESVEATGTEFEDNLYDFPKTMEARWVFKDPDFTLTWIQPGTDGDVLPGEKYGMTFYGEAGELRTKFGGHAFYADGKEAELPKPARSVDVERSPGHFRNFLDSIVSRKPPIADVEIGHRTNSICLLGNIALSTGAPLRWDWKAERFIDNDAANVQLSRAPREPYAPRTS